MFVSIQCVDSNLNAEGTNYNYSYILEDSELGNLTLSAEFTKDEWEGRGSASLLPAGLMDTYLEKNMPIAKNIALFYAENHKNIPLKVQLDFVKTDSEYIDKIAPALKFSEKYAPCIANQLKLLQHTGKNKVL